MRRIEGDDVPAVEVRAGLIRTVEKFPGVRTPSYHRARGAP